jgi:hypothetical protein
MFLHNQEDCLYIYSGYSKEKVLSNNSSSSSKKEGKIHDDMWCINLKNVLNNNSNSSSNVGIDLTKIVWQRISRKGLLLLCFIIIFLYLLNCFTNYFCTFIFL